MCDPIIFTVRGTPNSDYWVYIGGSRSRMPFGPLTTCIGAPAIGGLHRGYLGPSGVDWFFEVPTTSAIGKAFYFQAIVVHSPATLEVATTDAVMVKF